MSGVFLSDSPPFETGAVPEPGAYRLSRPVGWPAPGTLPFPWHLVCPASYVNVRDLNSGGHVVQ